ncbi:hypothetical protein D0Z03_001977 [Geotrichum reessii]|nr:hypothetical protein D0Z03_001977 [Galactomyces reessii]
MSNTSEDADLELKPSSTLGLASEPTASESAINATGTSSTADQGYYRNCMDFWFPQGDLNVFKALPEGTAAMGNVSVNYYTLWDFPSLKNQDYELVENIV